MLESSIAVVMTSSRRMLKRNEEKGCTLVLLQSVFETSQLSRCLLSQHFWRFCRVIGADLPSWMGIPGVVLLLKGPLAEQCQMLFDNRYSIGGVWSLNFLVYSLSSV